MHIIMKLEDMPGCLLYETQHLAQIASGWEENKAPAPFLFPPCVKKECLVCFSVHAEETWTVQMRIGRSCRERASRLEFN